MKTIAHYRHEGPGWMPAQGACQCGSEHAGEDGGFYVSVVDGSQYGLLAGPFGTHPEALALVNTVRAKAEELNTRAVFYSFGTLRAKDGYRKPGRLNKYLGLPTEATP